MDKDKLRHSHDIDDEEAEDLRRHSEETIRNIIYQGET